MHSAKCAGIALVALAAMAACGGSGRTLPPCMPMLLPAFFMVYPSPGATGVPDNLGEIVFRGFAFGPVSLTSGAQAMLLNLEPAPTPTPTPLNALEQWTAAVPMPLSANTTYTAGYTFTNSGTDCASYIGTFDAGSFTTK